MSTNEEVITNIHRSAAIEAGTMALVTASGENSRDHGFHDDWPQSPALSLAGGNVEANLQKSSEYRQAQRRAIAEKLALIHEEVSEALGEIRSGRDPLEIYYVHKSTGLEYEEQQYDVHGVPQCKPEGFLVELADANIRIADLAYLVGDVDGAYLAAATAVKAEYNATRPYKHGRKF